MFKRQGANQSTAVCLWSQVLIVLALVLLGWAAFSELFSNQAVIRNRHDQGDIGSLKDSHFYSMPVSVIDQVDCAFLTRVKLSAQTELNKINSNWQVQNFPNFLRMMHIPPTSWSLQKAKFISLILEQSQAVANGKKNDFFGRTYVAGFSGSSVTAGHDNYFHEAFPAVFERALSTVFTTMNMKLVVRNNAIGNNPCFPYDACIATHLGDDLDILAWEQSMNCGRESRPLDTFTRSALRMKKSPTVMYVLSGGPAWRPEECPNITAANKWEDLQKQRLLTLPSIKQIRDSASQLDASMKTDEKSSNILSSMEFLRDGAEHLFDAHRFAAAAPMGHSTFPCHEYRCFGPYHANFTAKTPGGNGANWHPGTLGHKLRGENMAYFFLAMLIDAIESIEAAVRLVPNSCPGAEVYESKVKNTISISELSAKKDQNDTNSELFSAAKALRKAHKFNAKESNSETTMTAKKSKNRSLSSLSSSVSSDSFHVVFPTNLRLPLLISTLQLDRIATAPAIDINKLEARILRYVHHYYLTDNTHNTGVSSTPSLSQDTKEVTVNIWTMLSAYIQEYLYHQLHHPYVVPPVPPHYHIDETAFPPQCFTNFEPRTWQDHSISTLMINVSAPNSPIKVPSMHNHDNNNNSSTNNEWILQLSPFDVNAVRKGQERGLGYLDRKYAFFSQGLHSMLYLKIHMAHSAPIWLCELQKGFLKYPASMTDLDLGAEIFLHVNYFQRHGLKLNNDNNNNVNDNSNNGNVVFRGSGGSSSVAVSSSNDMAANTVMLAEGMGLSTTLKANSNNNNNVDQHVLDDPAFTVHIDLATFSDQCYRSKTLLPPGHHLLSIQQKGLQQINLAYVVTF